MTTGEEAVTGRDIIASYRNGKQSSAEKYQRLCQALDIFDKWDEETQIGFLSQFLELSDLLDSRCSDLVNRFCTLEWHVIPKKLRKNFVDLLRDIAIRHVVHVETVLRAIVSHFVPKLKLEESNEEQSTAKLRSVPAIAGCEQEDIYIVAREAIRSVLSCLPAASRILVKSCRSVFPHYSTTSLKTIAYMRHLLLLSEQHRPIAQELWSIVIDNVLQLDAIASSHSDGDSGVGLNTSANGVFTIEDVEVNYEYTEDEDTIEKRLDICINVILCYVSRDFTNSAFSVDNAKHTAWILTTERPKMCVFETLLPAFVDCVLYAHDVQSVSFVWLYICSLSKEYEKRLLSTLWKTIIAPTRSPNEWKKAHNAAAFLGGILARANYIDFSTSYTWMKEMALWCGRYVDQVGIPKTAVGGIQHGTFYAVVQALLYVFCFRYKELVEKRMVEDVHVWGFGRIIHSNLEPLKYVSPVVALCFANVSRHLQLVYCNHILNLEEESSHPPVEPYFPFNQLRLPLCSRILRPLLRHFSPADDETPVITTEMSMREKPDDEYDFMMEEDDDIRIAMDTSQAKFLLSTSPLNAFSAMAHLH